MHTKFSLVCERNKWKTKNLHFHANLLYTPTTPYSLHCIIALKNAPKFHETPIQLTMNRFLSYLIVLFIFFYTPFSTQAVVENNVVPSLSTTSSIADSTILPDASPQPISNGSNSSFKIFDKSSRWMIWYPLIFLGLLFIFFILQFTSGRSTFRTLTSLVFLKNALSSSLAAIPLYVARWQIRKHFASKNILNKEQEALSRRAYTRFAWLYLIGLLLLTWLIFYPVTLNQLVLGALSHGGSYVGQSQAMYEATQKGIEHKKKYSTFKGEPVTLIPMKINEQYGYKFKNGNVAIETKYQMTTVFSEGLAQVKLNNKWGYINQEDANIIDFEYESAQSFSEGLAAVQLKGKFGYINREGKFVLPCVYDAANDFKNGKATVWRNGQEETITSPSEWLAPTPTVPIEAVGEKKENPIAPPIATKTLDNRVLILLERAGKYGFQDTEGNIVIPVKYQVAYSFSEGLAQVRLNNKWGFVNKKGEAICSFLYDDCNAFQEGLAVVQSNGKYGYINKEGKIIFPCIYDWANDFQNGQARVELNNRVETLILFSEQKTTPVAPKQPEPELRLLERAGKFGFIDLNGNTVITPKYAIAYDFSEGLAQVQLNNKWGFINKKGEIICPIQYDDCNPFSEGLAVVQKNGYYGYIGKNGKLRILPQYSSATNFKNGTAHVEKDGREFEINTEGRGSKKD